MTSSTWSDDVHPPMVDLEATHPSPSVQTHLAACARCRVDRRMLTEPEEQDPSSYVPTWTGVGSIDDLMGTWLSARSALAEPSFAPIPTPPSPEDLGRYAIDAVLGQGGMAVVYRVFELGRPDHRYAIKLLFRAEPELRLRLHREGRLQMDLKHDNVVRVVEHLQICDEPALLLEYVPGPSLRAVLKDVSLPLPLLDGIARDVLRGVSAAHRAGVVHRDLKPGNVLLAPTRSRFIAKVADFGLARSNERGDDLITRTGAFAGTPLYMSPEQLRDASRADARSDVFSLGALLYEIVTGLRCFAGLDYVDIVRRVADVRYVDPAAVVPGLPERMTAAIRAALQEDPSARPESASELLTIWEGSSRTSVDTWPVEFMERVHELHVPRALPADAAHHGRPRGVHNLGKSLNVFVGRHGERVALADLLLQERLVTICGPAGVGKTRIAQEIGRDVVHRFDGGVWFCDLTSARSASGIAAAVAEALSAPIGRDPVVAVGDVLLGRGCCLIVLDNFEHLLEHAEQTVEAWLDHAPEVRFLVTSRAPLDLLDEHTESLSTLPVHKRDGDKSSDAVALFAARARIGMPTFVVDERNRADVADLVGELDGLPLAIEIVAARVRSQHVGKLMAKLRSRLQRLPAPSSSTDRRHRTLEAALDWSWSLATAQERSVLAQCSVFAGGWTLEAADHVVTTDKDTATKVLRRLVRQSLVQHSTDSTAPRFGMLVSVQEYCANKLTQTGQKEAAQRRHAAWCSTWALRDIQDQGTQDVRPLAVEAANLVRAVGSHTHSKDAQAAHALLRRALPVLYTKHPIADLLSLSDSIMRVATGEAVGLVHGLRGSLRLRAGELSSALQDLDASIRLLEGTARFAALQNAYNQRGVAQVRAGDFDDAEDSIRRSLHIAEQSGRRHHQLGHAYANLAIIQQRRADHKGATALFERALQAHRDSGDRRGEALVMGELGCIHEHSGRIAEAERLHRESIQILEDQSAHYALVVAYRMLAILLLGRRQSDAAIEACDRSIDLGMRSGARYQVAASLEVRGGAQLQSNRLTDASLSFELSLAQLREQGDLEQVRVLCRLSVVRAREGSHKRAAALLSEAMGRPQSSGVRERAMILSLRAEVAWLAGDVEQGRTLLRQATQLGADTGFHERSQLRRTMADLADRMESDGPAR